MARQEGILKFSGELGGLVAYKLNGEWVVRRKGTISKKRYAKDPAFDHMRRSNKEFGGASTMAKALRDPWKFYLNKCKDKSLCYRMNALLLENIKMSIGIFGQRICSWNELFENMNSFLVNNSKPLNNYLSKEIEIQNVNNTIIWESNNVSIINAPKGATHFKIFTLINQIPEFSFSSELDKYIKGNNSLLNIELFTDIHPIDEPISFTQSSSILPGFENFTVAQGLVFFQLVNNNYLELSELPLEWVGVVCT